MSLVTLIRLTLIELWRQRLVWVPIAVLFVLLLAVSMPFPEAMVNGEPLRPRASDVAGLSYKVLQFLGVFLGLVVGAGLISSEVERGTILLLATKPISRWGIVLGKALGGFVFLAACFLAWGLVLAGAVGLRLEPGATLPVLAGALLGVLPAWLFASLALVFSTRLPALGAMAGALFTWIAASAAPSLASLKDNPSYQAVGKVAEWVSWAIPAGPLDALPTAIVFGPAPLPAQVAALLAIPGWLVVAALLFERRNLS